MEKRRVEMNRRPRHLRRPLSSPPDETLFPFPTFSSSDDVFQKYNMEALRIYGNQFGVFICWKCKMQFTSEEEHLAHLREHERGEIDAQELERRREKELRRQKEEEERRETERTVSFLIIYDVRRELTRRLDSALSLSL